MQSTPFPRTPPHRAVWLYAVTTVWFFAASSAPTPLYRVYQQRWHFDAAMLTTIFDAYAVSVLVALLTTGSISDFIGRRKVVVSMIGLEIVSLLVFAYATSVHALIVARLLQGFATGAAVSALGAAIMDTSPTRGTLLNSITPVFGMGLGALGTSAMLAYTHAPVGVAYWVLIAVFCVLAAGCATVSDTFVARPFPLRRLIPEVRIPAVAKRPMWLIGPANIAIWALNGFYLSLGPSLAREITGSSNPMIGGAVVFTLTSGAVLAIIRLRHSGASRMLSIGTGLFCAGLLVTLAGVLRPSLAVFLVGTAFSGAGFGSVLQGGLRTILPKVELHERAALLAAFYILSYLAFSVPVLAAGIATAHHDLESVAVAYALGLLLLALLTLVAHAVGNMRRISAPE